MSRYVALDLETEQLSKMPHGKIHAVFFAEAGVEPCAYKWGEGAVSVIAEYLADSELVFVIQNAKFDVWVLRHHGVDIPAGRYVDTMVAAHCVNPTLHSYALEGKLDYAELMGYAKNDPSVYDLPFNPHMEEYGKHDVRLTLLWWGELLEHLEADERMAGAFWSLHVPFVEVMISLSGGLHVNLERCIGVASELVAETAAMNLAFLEKYPKVARLKWDKEGCTFRMARDKRTGAVEYHPPNIESPNDIVSLLYSCGWVPEEFKRGTGRPVTSQMVLRSLAKAKDTPPKLAEVASDITELRSCVGILGQMTQLMTLADRGTGLLKGSWHQTGTVTYRLSSSSPNMQNLSTRHPKWGGLVRGCFDAPPGYAMLCGDLSQIELAILGWYLEVVCGDSRMAEGNRAGEDAHDTNTRNWYGITKEDDPVLFKQQRGKSKTGVFARGYGAGAKRLAFTLGVTAEEAQDILDKITEHSDIDKLRAIVFAKARQSRAGVLPVAKPTGGRTNQGFLYDLLDTRLFYPGLASKDKNERKKAERQTFNALMQGGCSSILRKLCNESLPHIKECGGWFAGLVHDEALVYVPQSKAEQALDALNQVWNSMVLPSEQGGVYVRADFHVVSDWSEK